MDPCTNLLLCLGRLNARSVIIEQLSAPSTFEIPCQPNMVE